WSFSDLSEHVRVVDGRFPNYLPPVPNRFYNETEIAIGKDAFDRLNLSGMTLQIGDQLRNGNETMRLNLVGVVEPVDATNQVWWGDLLPFSYLRPPNFSVQPDTVTLSVLLNARSMPDYFFGHQTTWRVLTDVSQINVDNVEETAVALQTLETQLQSSFATGIDTDLLNILGGYLNELDSARVTLFLLAIQSLLFVLYTLAMISSFLLDQSRGELATLAGRGFNGRQITLIFAMESGLLALIAAPVGPGLAKAALTLWGQLSDTIIPSAIPVESWLLTLLAVFFGWATLVVSIYFGARGNILDWQQQLARPPKLARWQRAYVDIFMLVLGGLIYWQLADTGTFLSQSASGAAGGADPFLLLGPSLLLIGVALIFLRIFPLLLRLFAWLTRKVDSLILPFGLAKLSRDPVGPSRVVLLVSLAAGLTLFTSTFENSMSSRQNEMANHLTGADLLVKVPNAAQQEAYTAVADHTAVLNWSPVYTNRSRWGTELGRVADMIAVDPESFALVSEYAPYLTALTVDDVLPGVVQGESDAIPAVFSLDMWPQNAQIGDRVIYIVGQYKVEFEVRGFIRQFPGVDNPFFITNLEEVEKKVNLETLTEPWRGSKQVWMDVDPALHAGFVDDINGRMGNGEIEAISGDARRMERTMQSHMIAMQAIGAFNLNAVTLVVLSVGIFLMVHFFAARQRLYEFSLLRSMGLTARQLLVLLSLEGVIMMVLGLLAGSGLGFGLAAVMRPFLSRTLSDALGGDTIRQLVIKIGETSGLYGLLIAFYAIALGLLLVFLLRSGIHRALRIGEE
ncbi:MAG: hypothetical protein GY943_01340, partial [Chloroflexi bacterium]|nr:hypothetical protein [Chloroflexota bacterium]